MSKEVNEERTPRTVEDVKEMLTKHSNGEIQRTIQNCITILQNDHVLADAIRLNLLSERIDIVKPVGWPPSGKTLNDTDMKYILRRMEKYGISSEKKIESLSVSYLNVFSFIFFSCNCFYYVSNICNIGNITK